MKILVLAWEFPPRLIGGISRHVAELYPELVKLGHTIHLITVEVANAPNYEIVEGIHVHRVPVAPGHDFFHWVANMNESMGHYGGKLILEQESFDLIHAHDWLVGDAAIALKYHFHIPLIATIHATEYGRYNGIHNKTHDYIHGKEKYLAQHAQRIIVCTNYMRHEVERVLNVPWDKMNVIYNGIRPEKKQHSPEFDYLAFRRLFAKDQEKLVYYVGRMTHEKGVFVLLNAAPKIIAELEGNVKFILIGEGQTQNLKQQVWNLGIWDFCNFTGFMSDADLDKFQTVADCAVFPSLYEPFGIVALESFAALVPVVVSNTGGLPEVVKQGETGIVTQANDAESLAEGILTVLKNPEYGKFLTENAFIDLFSRFNWSQLAQETAKVYDLTLQVNVTR